MTTKKSKYLIITIFIWGCFFFGGMKAFADIDVSNWNLFGQSYQDYRLEGFLAKQIRGGTTIDLRKDITYLGYRGSNIEDDITINSRNIDATKDYELKSKTDVIVVKKIGVVDGKYIEVRIKPILTPLKVSFQDKISLLKFTTSNINVRGDNYHINMEFYYQGTNKLVTGLSEKNLMLPTTIIYAWPTYQMAWLVDRDTKVLIGDQERDKPTYQNAKTSTLPYTYKLGIGGANYVITNYYYNFLLNKTYFNLGIQVTDAFAAYSFGVFDPIDFEASVPKTYDNVSFSSLDNKDGTLANEISFRLPKQDKESFYPEKVELNIGKYLADDFTIKKPSLSYNNDPISEDDYSYDSTGKFTFSKEFLKSYAGNSIDITYKTELDYKSERILADYYDPTAKVFKIPNAIKIKSIYDSFSKIEFDEEKVNDVIYPLELTAVDLKAEVELGTSTSDYSKDTFVKDGMSNFPNDTVEVSIQPVSFDSFKEEMILPVTLTSNKLKIAKTINATVKPYRMVKISYSLEDGRPINPASNIELPTKVKHLYNKPISFKVPSTFESYTFKNVEPKDLSIYDREENMKEISGHIDEKVTEIKTIWAFNFIEVTVEYLLDGLGGYETHLPVKEGENLEQNKQSITLKATIDQSIKEFIEQHTADILPEVKYYQKNKDTGLISNYWHYTGQPVGKDNPSRPVEATDKMPNKPITLSTMYRGKAVLNRIDNLDFGKSTTNLQIDEILPKKAINYNFIDTTKQKGKYVSVQFQDELLNEADEPLTAFSLMFNNQLIGKQNVKVIDSIEKDKNSKTGDLSPNFLFKRFWTKPENTGNFKGTLVWSITDSY